MHPFLPFPLITHPLLSAFPLPHGQVRQQYIMELPPGLEPDPSMFKSSTISVDDDAVDRQYRKLFGPPDAKTV